MKLTHTLCAALLLGALSTPAFAQSKSKPKAAAIIKPAQVDMAVNASAKPDCTVAISAKDGQRLAVPAAGCGEEKRVSAKKPCINAKGVKCSKAERAAAFIKIGDIKGESASVEKPCKNNKDVKCPTAERSAAYLKIGDIKGESTD